MSTAECTLAEGMQKTLLIVGAGVEQIPAYQRAKARGLNVVGTDMNPEAPAFAYTDDCLLASTRDPLATLDAVRSFTSRQAIHGVMTIANDVPLTVATVAEALDLPAISPHSAKLATDKLLMKQAFSAGNVACPWFASVSSPAELKRLMVERGAARYVIKPVDGRGARGVLLIDLTSDLVWAFEEAQRWGDCGRVMLEEFVPGLQISSESFLIDGVAYTPALAERNYEFLDRFAPYIIENGGTIPAVVSGSTRQEINRLIERGAAALGVTEGIVKGDLIVTADGKPLIVELALRLSGGWFATHQIPAASGVSLVDAAISYALGEPVLQEKLTPKFDRATAIRYWFPEVGRIESIRGESNLMRLPGLIAHGFFRKPGDRQPEIRMHPDRFGYLIVDADDRETALARVRQGIDMVKVEVA